MNDDAIFWERLEDMPAWEAEQELVLRREHNQIQLGVLATARAELAGNFTKAAKQELATLGAECDRIHRQMTLINERIKYLRRLMDRSQWKEAVRSLFGQDGFEQCAVWIEQNFGHIHEQRRAWANK